MNPENPENDPATDKSLATILAVVDYLAAQGWRANKTTVYRHQQQGKLIPDKDGTYQLKDVDKYAKTWLKQQATGKKVNEAIDALQRRKIDLEIQNQEEDLKRKKWNFEREQKKYIKRDEVELELAARAGILDAGLKHMVKSHAAEWIRLAGGDMARVGELIALVGRQIDEHMNNYAAQMEFDVTIAVEDETNAGDDEPIPAEGVTKEGEAMP